MNGTTLGPYRIVERLGRGGMAAVYKAYQPSLDRYVAIKVLPAHLADEPGFAERFRREARAVAKLEHPHILPVHDYGQEGERTYIAMRYVEGGTLKDLLGKPLALPLIVDLIGQIAEALDYAHEHGIIHRDVKPSNVLLDRGNWALLTDFGVARMVEATQQLTGTGVGVGTPAYMSPEQGQGKKVDRRSDVYSLGVVLYEMLTGRVPFEAETPLAVVWKHVNEPLPLPRSLNPETPGAFERVVLKAMAKEPGQRFETAMALGEAIARADADSAPTPIRTAKVQAPPARAAFAEVHPDPKVGMRRLRLVSLGLPALVAVAVLAIVGVVLGTGAFKRGDRRNTSLASEMQGAQSTSGSVQSVSGVMTYDDFEDAKYDGGWNRDLWTTEGHDTELHKVYQKDGTLVIENRSGIGGPVLLARARSVAPTQGPVTFEAELRLDADTHGPGTFSMGLRITPQSIKGFWQPTCGFDTSDGRYVSIGCSDALYATEFPLGMPDSDYYTPYAGTYFGIWHRVRIELDPATMTVTYFVDDELVGTNTPDFADELMGSPITMFINSWANPNVTPETAEALIGSFDNVRAGQVLSEGLAPDSESTTTALGQTEPAQADPTLYDDFSSSEFDGLFNPELWEAYPSLATIQQGDGYVTLRSPDGRIVDLDAKKRLVFLTPQFLEADLMLDGSLHDGVIRFSVGSDLPSGQTWGAECLINREGHCLCLHSFDEEWPGSYATPYGRTVAFDTWHTFRMEFDPPKGLMSFFLDGQLIGSLIPEHIYAMKGSTFHFWVGVLGAAGGRVVGYADNIRTGTLDQ